MRALIKKIANLNVTGDFAFVRGDLPPQIQEIPFCFLTKARQSFSHQFGTILKCTNMKRHWSELDNISKSILAKFEDRKNQVVWRGATTGFLEDSKSRFALVKNTLT